MWWTHLMIFGNCCLYFSVWVKLFVLWVWQRVRGTDDNLRGLNFKLLQIRLVRSPAAAGTAGLIWEMQTSIFTPDLFSIPLLCSDWIQNWIGSTLAPHSHSLVNKNYSECLEEYDIAKWMQRQKEKNVWNDFWLEALQSIFVQYEIEADSPFLSHLLYWDCPVNCNIDVLLNFNLHSDIGSHRTLSKL